MCLTAKRDNFYYFQVPRESLLFVIPAFGGTVSWEGEGAPFDENDDSITYQVCFLIHYLRAELKEILICSLMFIIYHHFT